MLASCQIATPAPSPSPSAPAEDACHIGTTVYCVLNPDVTPETIRETICVVGWTATIRPPSTYTSALKSQQMLSERLPGTAASYEEDHRAALELGGAPADSMNLSPESHATSYVKDADENHYRQLICSGAMGLREAQKEFIGKWLGPWPAYLR